MPDVCWVDAALPAGRVAVTPHPVVDRLMRVLRELRQAGADVIISLLEPHEAADIGLESEGDICEQVGIRFVNFPIHDRSVPSSMADARRVLEDLHGTLHRGRSLVFHCWAGIGRSSLMAASLLTLCGLSPEDAFHAIGQARGLRVPDTQAQRVWVEAFARGADLAPPA
jgi:protein-tyrosine phosphatase